MKTISLCLFSLVFAWLAAACSSTPSSITPSTSPVPAGTRGSLPAYGSSCEYYLLGFVPVSTSLDSQEALEEAKNSADAEVLTDVTTDYGGGYYLLFSNRCVRVQGKGVPRAVSDSWKTPQ